MDEKVLFDLANVEFRDDELPLYVVNRISEFNNIGNFLKKNTLASLTDYYNSLDDKAKNRLYFDIYYYYNDRIYDKRSKAYTFINTIKPKKTDHIEYLKNIDLIYKKYNVKITDEAKKDRVFPKVLQNKIDKRKLDEVNKLKQFIEEKKITIDQINKKDVILSFSTTSDDGKTIFSVIPSYDDNKTVDDFIDSFEEWVHGLYAYTTVPKFYSTYVNRSNNPTVPLSKLEQKGKNCFITILENNIKNKRILNSKKHKSNIEQLHEKYKDGIQADDIKIISKKYNMNITIYDILGKIWVKSEPNAHYKNLDILHHDNHVIEAFSSFPKKQVFLTNDELKRELTHYNSNIFDLQYSDTNHKTVLSYKITDTIYKNSNELFISELDQEKNGKNIPMEVLTLASRLFKVIKENNHLQNVFDLPKEASNFLNNVNYKSINYSIQHDNKQTYFYDQKRAFSRYRESKYYSTYQLPYLPTHFYKLLDQSMVPQILQKTGFCSIKNVNLSHPFLKTIKWIQNGGVYTNLRLKFLLEHKLASFEIDTVAYNINNIDINFNLTSIDGIDIPDDRLKNIQNSLIGKLKPNLNKGHSTIRCKNKEEFDHLTYIIGEDIVYSSETKGNSIGYPPDNETEEVLEDNEVHDEKTPGLYITYKRECKPKSYIHVYSYILDYQATSILPFILDNHESLLNVVVDGIELSNKACREPFHDEFFKPMEIIKRKPYREFTYGSGIRDTYHESRNINYKAQNFPNFYNRSELLISRDRILIEGSAGCGKTSTLIDPQFNSILFNSIILLPTNVLKNNIAADNIRYINGIPAMTISKYFGLNTTYQNTLKPYSNIIIDESTMVNQDQLEIIKKKIASRSVNLYLIQGINQLLPVKGIPIDYQEFKTSNATITLTDVKRSKNHEYIAKQNSILHITDIWEKIEIFKDHIILEEDIKTLYRFGTEDIILCSTNVLVEHYNEKFYEEAKKTQPIPIKIPIMYLRTTSKHSKNERKLISIEEYQKDSRRKKPTMKLGFVSTIHVVQGLTIDYNVFFIAESLFDHRLFNVACSRNITPDKFKIVMSTIAEQLDYEQQYYITEIDNEVIRNI